MKLFISLLAFIVSSTSLDSQVTRLDIMETIDSNDMYLMSISDTKKFEYYDHCSLDKGVELKPHLKDGTYEIYLNDTLSYRAHYINRKKDSSWTYFYSNGQISSRIPYSKGFKNGIYQQFYENGTIKSEGVYTMGRMTSEWVNYDQNGNVTTVYTFNNGDKTNQIEYYHNGNKKREESFENGKYEGKNLEYYQTGELQKELYYTSDTLIRWVWYDREGTITLDKTLH